MKRQNYYRSETEELIEELMEMERLDRELSDHSHASEVENSDLALERELLEDMKRERAEKRASAYSSTPEVGKPKKKSASGFKKKKSSRRSKIGLPMLAAIVGAAVLLIVWLVSMFISDKQEFSEVHVTEDNRYGGITYQGYTGSITTYGSVKYGKIPKESLKASQKTIPLLCETRYIGITLDYHRDGTLMDAETDLRTKERVEKVGEAYKEFYQGYDYFTEVVSETDKQHPDGPFPIYEYTCIKDSHVYVITVRYDRTFKESCVSIAMEHKSEEEIEDFLEYTQLQNELEEELE